MPGFVPSYIYPTVTLPGQVQTFEFGSYQGLSQFQISNIFTPTTNNSSQNCFEFMNVNSSGFRFRQLSSSGNTTGNLILESFVNGAIPGSPIITFQQSGIPQLENTLDMNSNSIINVPLPVNPTDAVNKEYVDSEFSTGVTSATGTTNQIVVSGTGSGPYTGAITLSLPSSVVITTSLAAGNLELTGNTLESTNTNGNIILTPNGTGIISLTNNTGIGTTTPHSALQFASSINNRIITLYEANNNLNEFYGFGIAAGILRYQVYAGASHVFYVSTSSSTSNEIARIDGTANLYIGSNGSLRFRNSGATQYVGFQAPSLSANTIWTLPTTDSSGTQALLSNGSAVLSFGILPLSAGGTNANLTASNGGIFYSTSSAASILAGTSTPNQIVLSGSSAAPSWSTATYPATTTINQILYSSSTNTITGLATANNSIVATNGSGVPSLSGTLPFINPISTGGTGSSTASGALTNLGALPIAGGTMTGNLILNADPTTALGAVTKEYADAISQGLTFKDSCYAATTANLNAVYVNGVAGIGATLTNAGTLLVFSLDGVSPPVNARILVKNQTTAYQNGIYNLTTVGSSIIAYVLTRSTDYNSSSEIGPGDFILIDNGTVNASTAWVETATVNTIGTDSISFSQFGNPGTVTNVSGTTGQIDVANGTSTPVISIDAGYVGQTSITTLGTITIGTWNGSIISGTFGGTGVNNGAKTITLGGNLTTSGSFTTTLTVTANTNVTLPTSGTLVNTSVTSLSSLTTVGSPLTIGSNVLTLAGNLTTSGAFNSTFTMTGTTSVTFPTSGTLATTSLIPSFPLSLANGGTNAALTASNGGMVYSTSSALAILSGTSTANQIILSGATAAPTWSTATYPATTTINQLLYSSAANTIGGLATANNGVLITSSGGVPSIGSTLPLAVQGNITQTGTVTSGNWEATITPQANLNMNTYAIYNMAPIGSDLYANYLTGQAINFDWFVNVFNDQVTLSGISPQYIFPNVILPGQTQQFQFQNNHSLSQFQLINLYTPTSNASSQNCFEFMNVNSSGFRFRQLSSSGNTTGNLILESFVNGTIPGSPIITFQQSGIPQLENTLDMNSNSIINVPLPVNPTDAVNKEYGDNSYLTSINTGYAVTSDGGFPIPTLSFNTAAMIRAPCRVATTANLTATYQNHIPEGVGATLTNSGTQVALAIDGVTLALNDRVLVKNESTPLQNGIYVATNLGSGSTNWVLTRANDYALGSTTLFNDRLVLQGDSIIWVTSGTLNGGTPWIETGPGPFTVGTTAITFSGGCVSSLTGTTNQITVSQAIGAITLSLPSSVVITTSLAAGNLELTGNTLESTNTNGNIVLTPNGTGIVSVTPNMAIGTTTANSPLQFANQTINRIITLWEQNNNSHEFYGFGINGGVLRYQVYAGASHVFYVSTSSTTSTQLMNVNAGGNGGTATLGINTPTPLAGCHVTGGVQNVSGEDTCFRAQSSSNSAKMEFDSTSSSGRLYEIRSTNIGTLDIVDRTAAAEKLVINTTGVGIAGTPDTNFSVTTGTADKPGGGSWGSFSDQRIKKVIGDYDHGLSEILQITPKIYKYSLDPKLSLEDQQKERIGIIAQDIEDILPECITLRESKGFSDLRYYDSSPLLYTLINAVKELSERIQNLEATIH